MLLPRWRMPPLGVLLLLLAVLLPLAISAAPADKQLSDVQAAIKKQGRTSLQATDSLLRKFLRAQPRSYSVFMLLTASPSQYKCGICQHSQDEFELAASTYARAARGEPEGVARPSVFMVADLPLTKNAFQHYDIRSVPQIFHFPPQRSKAEGGDDAWPEPERVPITAAITAEMVASLAGDKTGFRFEVHRPKMGLYMMVMLVLTGAAALVVAALRNPAPFLRLARNRTLWLVVSLIVYTLAISGAVFDIIRSPMPFGVHPKTHKPVWFNPQANTQYVAEGFITGLTNLFTAISGMVVAIVAPRARTRAARQAATVVALAAFSGLFWMWITMYRWKNRWYMVR